VFFFFFHSFTVRAPVAKFAFTVVITMAFGRVLLATLLGEDGFSIGQQKNTSSEEERFFNTPGSACTGIFLNYHMCRMFERLMGSRKFGSLLLFSYLLCYCLEFILTKVVGEDVARMEKPAAFYITLPLAVVYFVEIPSTFHFTLFGVVNCGNTIFVYLAMMHLAMSNGYASLLTTLVSVVAGSFAWMLVECMGVKLPLWLCSLVDKTVGRVFNSGVGSSLSPREKAIVRFGIGNRSAAAHAERRRRGREGGGGPFVLDEHSVNTLLSMGFSEQRVKQTLHVTNNNIEAAMNILLNEN